MCRLEISMTFADDAGEYVILAKNQLGEVSASTNLLDEGVSTKYHEEVHKRGQTEENKTKRKHTFETFNLLRPELLLMWMARS